MRYTLILLALAFSGKSYSQYSGYYMIDKNVNTNVNQNINANVNLNQNVDVSGHVSKTITTIDYGALAQANAMKEANRLSAQKLAIDRQQYADEVARENAILFANQALEIAADPFKADLYGTTKSFTVSASEPGWEGLMNAGFVSYIEYYTLPHGSLFQNVGVGRFENISIDGITTEILLSNSEYNNKGWPQLRHEEAIVYYKRIRLLMDEWKSSQKPKKKEYPSKEQYEYELLRWNEMCDSLDNLGFVIDPRDGNILDDERVGTKILGADGDSIFLHKTESQKRTVYGHPGFRHTDIWEDDYNICITDNYISYHQGITSRVKVRYKADKSSNITFEDLEGRRFYLLRFVDRHVAGRRISSPEYASPPTPPNRKDFIDFQAWEKAIARYNLYGNR